LFYGFTFGIGVGLGYTSPMIAGWSWLPQAKGLVSGGVLAGFGMGGFIFNLLGSYLVNPTGEDPVDGLFPDAVYERFPGMLRTLCVCFVVLATAGTFLITEKSTAKKNGKKEGAMPPDSVGVSVWEAVRTPQFYLLWVMIVMSASAGLNVVAMHKSFAHTRPALKGDSYQALVGGLGALVNSVSRLFWGSLSDKIGFKTSFTVLTLVQAIVQLLYTHSAYSKSAFLAANCLAYACLAGTFAMMPPAVQRIFGAKNGALIYGLLYSAFGVASVGTTFLSKALVASVGWAGVFRVLAAVSVCATLLTGSLVPLPSLPSSTV